MGEKDFMVTLATWYPFKPQLRLDSINSMFQMLCQMISHIISHWILPVTTQKNQGPESSNDSVQRHTVATPLSLDPDSSTFPSVSSNCGHFLCPNHYSCAPSHCPINLWRKTKTSALMGCKYPQRVPGGAPSAMTLHARGADSPPNHGCWSQRSRQWVCSVSQERAS